MLGYDLEGKKGEFFNFRHTASLTSRSAARRRRICLPS
jgi:hypothetical protein